MKIKLSDALPSLLITLLMLILLEIIGSTLFPVLGLAKYRLPFNILIILFLGFKLETPILSFLILVVQYFHSLFTIEGWAMGTFAGVFVCILISYFRELIHFSSSVVTVIITQIFQIVWFIFVSGILYFKVGSFGPVLEKLYRFLPESIVISLLAPFFFSLLDKIWKVSEQGVMGDNA